MTQQSFYITTIRSLFFVLCVLSSLYANAQSEDGSAVHMYVESELKPMKQSNMYSTTLKIVNEGSDSFVGKINISAPQGFRSISGTSVDISVLAMDSVFAPIRFIQNASMSSGKSDLLYTLSSTDGVVIDSVYTSLSIEERVDMSLFVQNRNIMITNSADSIRLSAKVTNRGNKAQDVTVVFSIPNLRQGINFVEQKYYLDAQEEHQFVFSFMPHKSLLAQNHFNVRIAAMYGSEKNIFGNSSIEVQNVSDNSVFEDPLNRNGLYNSDMRNTISLSYRGDNNDGSIAQMHGSADFDLPAGYINLKGNVYKYGTSYRLMASNTSLTYMLDDNEYQVGNVYESLEASLSGRGAKITLGSPRKKSLVVGVVDQEYNLFSDRPFFEDTYSVFAKAEINSNYSSLRKAQTSVIYQRNARYMTHDVIAGGELGWLLQNNWAVSLRMHGAISNAIDGDYSKPSASAELKYNGEVKGYNLAGNYYLSSNYFPGNRRGVTLLQQSASKKIKDFSIRASAYYSMFSPRSYVYDINTKTSNLLSDADIYFPKVVNVTFGMGYQHQYEYSNGYGLSQSSISDYEMQSNRIKALMTWSSRGTGHSVNLSTEVGLSNNSSSKSNKGQQRYNLSYSYKWLNMSTQYQRGSYYISEQISSSNTNRPYERFNSSIAVNKQMFDNKFSVMASASINKDFYTDYSPSAYLNMKYGLSKWFSLFVNSYWYSYKFRGGTSVNTYSNELGVTVHLNKNRATSSRKSRVEAFVYHDYNSNGVFDDGDKPAKGYSVSIDKKGFVTNDNGKVTYRKVPYGKYAVGNISEKGWFGDADTLKVDKFSVGMDIPLQQAGVLMGQINYSFDSRTSMDIEAKIEGVVFQITSIDGTVSRRVSTNDDATFTAFLPTGEYSVELVTSSLPANTSCKEPVQIVKIESGKMIKLDTFIIEVQQRKVNIRRFGQ